MKTNFFENIKGLAFRGNLNLTIAKGADDKLTVSVLLANDLPDRAARIIPPMLLKGEASELDEGFFSAIIEPLAKTTQLFANMEAYNKSIEEAQQKSREQKDKKAKADKASRKSSTTTSETTDDEDDDNETPETDNLFSSQEAEKQRIADKKKRYDDAMTQIGELNKQCKYKEAIALLPDAEEYPDKATEIQTKREGLEKRQKQYEELMQDI
jgi:PRTRC genetic system protein E